MSVRVEPHLVEAFRKILRPLVKVLIRGGVRFEDCVRIVKGVYAESAIRDGSGVIGEASIAKLAMATGLSGDDLEEYVSETERTVPPRPTLAASLTQVLHVWHTESSYVGPYGLPLELEIEKSERRNFMELAASIDAELDPYELLDELLRTGLVVRVGEKFLKVVSRTLLVQEPMSPAMLEYFGNTVTSMTSTLEHNMDPLTVSKRLQRSVFADRGLTDRQILEFQRYAAQRVQDLMVDLDNWLADAPARLRDDNAPKRDVGVSVFQYVRSREREPSLREVFESLKKSA